MGHMTVISGAERRRRWSSEDRARILAAISEPGAVIADVAGREDICTSLIFKWRRERREAVTAAGGGFAPVVVEQAAPSLSLSSSLSSRGLASSVIEVELKDARVRIHADAPSSAIAATLKALRR